MEKQQQQPAQQNPDPRNPPPAYSSSSSNWNPPPTGVPLQPAMYPTQPAYVYPGAVPPQPGYAYPAQPGAVPYPMPPGAVYPPQQAGFMGPPGFPLMPNANVVPLQVSARSVNGSLVYQVESTFPMQLQNYVSALVGSKSSIL